LVYLCLLSSNFEMITSEEKTYFLSSQNCGDNRFLKQKLVSLCIPFKVYRTVPQNIFFALKMPFLFSLKKSVSSGHKPALVPDKWIFFARSLSAIQEMILDSHLVVDVEN